MSKYSYDSCFWDPEDHGVAVLLGHVWAGVASLESLQRHVRQLAESARDTARRMGASIEQFSGALLSSTPDYGQLQVSMRELLANEKSVANGFSKQSEHLSRQVLPKLQDFIQQHRAKLTTLSGKMDNLKRDKHNKLQASKTLEQRVQEAQGHVMEYQLNAGNTPGRLNERQSKAQKWESNLNELRNQWNILKQELKMSRRHWRSEWLQTATQLQELEAHRISFVQGIIQSIAESALDVGVTQQAHSNIIMSKVATFTPNEDIVSFSKTFGTGRLKEKKPNTTASSNKRSDPYLDSVRTLSSQLQRTSVREYTAQAAPQLEVYQRKSTSDKEGQGIGQEQLIHTHADKSENTYQNHTPLRDITASSDHKTPIAAYIANDPHTMNDQNYVKTHRPKSSSEYDDSSNPTDFSFHRRTGSGRRRSLDSMATSVSSLASSIDETQRFAKSWNSANRSRHRRSTHLGSSSNSYNSEPTALIKNPSDAGNKASDRNATRHSTIVVNDIAHVDNKNLGTTEFRTNTGDRRRKSIVIETSNDPIEDALLEMQRLQSDHGIQPGRIIDGGIAITLPTVTSTGENVIKFAKALYPILDNNAPGLIHMDVNDFLLITSKVNDEWYMGEVYGNDKINNEHKHGLIPYNFIQIFPPITVRGNQ